MRDTIQMKINKDSFEVIKVLDISRRKNGSDILTPSHGRAEWRYMGGKPPRRAHFTKGKHSDVSSELKIAELTKEVLHTLKNRRQIELVVRRGG